MALHSWDLLHRPPGQGTWRSTRRLLVETIRKAASNSTTAQQHVLCWLYGPGSCWESSNSTNKSCLQPSQVLHTALMNQPYAHIKQKAFTAFAWFGLPFSFKRNDLISVRHVCTYVRNGSRKSRFLLPGSRKLGVWLPYNINAACCTREHLPP